MDSGYYTAAIGMLDNFNVENNISDNLANMQTPGFKERSAVLGDFSQVLYNTQGVAGAQESAAIGRFGTSPQVQDYGMNLAQGNPKYTGSPLDLMIVGNGFFSVRAGNRTLLTRNGSFHRSNAGILVTGEGYPVLDKANRPLKIPTGTLEINKGGELRVNGKLVGRLGLSSVPVGQPLTQAGGGYFVGPGRPLTAQQSQSTGVLQGYLESSNVDMSTQMSAMMSAQRAYQADSRLLQMQDDTMSLAVNDLGKVNG